MRKVDFYSPYQFTLFRVVLGTYLILHFLPLLRFGPDVYSSSGSLPDASLSGSYGLFPSVFYLYDSPSFVTGAIAFMLLLACLLTLGISRRVVSLMLWYGWASLASRNTFAMNPSIPIVGWLLLASALVPTGEPFSLTRRHRHAPWSMPSTLFWGAWLVIAVSYSASGFFKLASPSWIDGTAIRNALEVSMSRHNVIVDAMFSLPAVAIRWITYGALLAELFFLPLCIVSVGRAVAWSGMLLMNLALLLLFAFPDLTCGVLLAHLFIFDARWLSPRSATSEKTNVYFDGVCGLCNRFVNLLLSEDRYDVLRFAPLQSNHAQALLSQRDTTEPETLVVQRGGRLFYHSDAALRAVAALGGIWTAAKVLFIVPRPLRDVVYVFIAKHRYRVFGKRDSCRLPTPEERSKFLGET